ncbi:MAG: mucoidy inhibitor MuiA family protein [Bacteroidia bacterium]
MKTVFSWPGKGKGYDKRVKFRHKPIKDESSEKLNVLIAEKEKLEARDLRRMNDQVKRLKSQRAFVDAIQGRITAPIESASSNELSPESWQNMLNFQIQQWERIDLEIQKMEGEQNEAQKSLNLLQRQIKQLMGGSSKTVKVVEADLELEEAGELELYLSYLVGNASWEPLYDFRVNTEREDMLVIYQALVRQSTGEDWTDVKLSLSTAKPHIYGKPPEIHPHFLRKFVPHPPVAPRVMAKKSARVGGIMMASAAPEPEMDMEEAMMSEQSFKPASVVKEQATSVIFELSEPMNVAGNFEPEQVQIFQTQLSTSFTHETVPSLTPYAFLRAEITNDSPYPLLAGRANIYMDGHYVSQTHLKFIAPGQAFKIHLGVDETVKVEHKVVSHFHKTEGFIGPKKDKEIFKFLITITNRKKIPVSMEVKDRYPFTQDNDIKVELVEPVYKEDTDALKKDEQNLLTFSQKVNAGEKWEIPIEYQVVYPKDITVEGL